MQQRALLAAFTTCLDAATHVALYNGLLEAVTDRLADADVFRCLLLVALYR